MDLFKEIDFSKEIQDNKDLKIFIQQASKRIQQQQTQILRKIKKPQLNDELLNQFIVTGIPVLKAQNEDKFLNLFKVKILQTKKIGQKNGLVNIQVGKVNGIGNQTLYLTYRNSNEAKAAFKQLNNYKFTKDNTFECFTINQIREFIELQQKAENMVFKVPELISREQKYEHNLDSEYKNQFVLRQNNNINLYWLDHIDKSCKTALPTQYLHTDYQVNKIIFSPLGAYLAVCAPEGVHIYAGHNLKYKCLLPQINPIDAKFSKNQKYIVTSNGNLSKNRQNFIIWALEQQIKLKSYKAYSNQSLQSFQFSQNSKYLAINHENEVGIYNILTVEKFKQELKLSEQERNSIKALHIQKSAWLKDNISLIAMCYQLDYHPTSKPSTRIFIYNVQTKQEKKWRAWGQHAKNGEIIISQKGDWIAITLKKFLKKNHFATVIQIANMLKKDQSLQISSLQIKQEVGNVSWDTRNNRFAVIHEDQSTKKGINVRYSVSFYEMFSKNKEIQFTKLSEIKDNLQNRVVLTNNGCFFALYNISQQSPQKGKFSLGLISKQTKQKGKKVVSFEFVKQNLIVNGMNFFQVDDSGRFILLGTEKGYQIWNFIGQIIFKDIFQKNIYNAQWRPRLFNTLTQIEQKSLIENQKQLNKKYKEIDDKRTLTLLSEKEKEKHKRKQDFLEFIKIKKQWYQVFVPKRTSILGFRQFQARTDKYQIEEDFIDLQ